MNYEAIPCNVPCTREVNATDSAVRMFGLFSTRFGPRFSIRFTRSQISLKLVDVLLDHYLSSLKLIITNQSDVLLEQTITNMSKFYSKNILR